MRVFLTKLPERVMVVMFSAMCDFAMKVQMKIAM